MRADLLSAPQQPALDVSIFINFRKKKERLPGSPPSFNKPGKRQLFILRRVIAVGIHAHNQDVPVVSSSSLHQVSKTVIGNQPTCLKRAPPASAVQDQNGTEKNKQTTCDCISIKTHQDNATPCSKTPKRTAPRVALGRSRDQSAQQGQSHSASGVSVKGGQQIGPQENNVDLNEQKEYAKKQNTHMCLIPVYRHKTVCTSVIYLNQSFIRGRFTSANVGFGGSLN